MSLFEPKRNEFADTAGQWFRSGAQGYLSERALMSALAISETLAGRDAMGAARYLKPHLAADLAAYGAAKIGSAA